MPVGTFPMLAGRIAAFLRQHPKFEGKPGLFERRQLA